MIDDDYLSFLENDDEEYLICEICQNLIAKKYDFQCINCQNYLSLKTEEADNKYYLWKKNYFNK